METLIHSKLAKDERLLRGITVKCQQVKASNNHKNNQSSNGRMTEGAIQTLSSECL